MPLIIRIIIVYKERRRVYNYRMHAIGSAHPANSLTGYALLVLLLPLPIHASATPDYARETGFESTRCHVDEKAGQPFHMKLFYFFAYMNLVLVFVITFVIALWRWW